MLRSILVPMAIAVIGLSAAIGSAYAQEGVVEEDLMIEEGMDEPVPAPAMEEPAEAMEPVPGPRVRGFTARRPTSCGEFKFWDGTQCADARDKKATQP
jgi:hypothetical protein